MSDIKDALLKIREHTNNTTYDLACLQVEATLELAEQVKRIADILDSAMEVDPENPGAGRYVWVRVREE